MKYRARPEQNVYINSMGKAFRVEAWATTDAEANAIMEASPHLAVIACIGPLVLLAGANDARCKRHPRNSILICDHTEEA